MHKLIAACCIIIASACNMMQAQDTAFMHYPVKPYALQNKVDIPMIGLIMVSSLSNIYWTRDDNYNFREAASLDASTLPSIDGSTLDIDPETSERADKLSDYLAYGSAALPIALVISTSPDYYEMITVGFMYIEGLAVTASITSNIKAAVNRPRPYTYSDAYTMKQRTDDEAWVSFPSGHTANTAYNCYFAASVLNRMYIQDKSKGLRIAVWSTAAIIPAVTGYLRTEAGKHFPTDVIAGYAFGAGMGLLTPYLHRTKLSSLAITPIRQQQINGVAMRLQF